MLHDFRLAIATSSDRAVTTLIIAMAHCLGINASRRKGRTATPCDRGCDLGQGH